MNDPIHNLRVQQTRRVGAAFLRARPLILMPVMAVLCTALLMSGEPGARTLTVGAVMGTMLTFFVAEAVYFRHREVDASYLLGSMLFTLLGISAVAAATGGVRSPVLPLLLAPTGVGLAAFGLGWQSKTVIAGLMTCMALLVAASLGDPWPPMSSPVREIMACGATAVCGVLLYVAVGGLSQAYVESGGALARTQRVWLDAASLRARDLEAVGGRVAHELKNPLAAARGLLQLVQRRATGDRDRQRLDVALTELDRMQDVVQNYLSFSRPLRPLDLSTFDLADLLGELCAAQEGAAQQDEVDLQTRCEPLLWTADRARLLDALTNLATNAVSACAAGGRVEIECEAGEEGVKLRIRDDGSGMDADVLARLGTPFFTTKSAGTGLGVVLARATAVQHGGQLSFESTPGEGTVATMRLPRIEAEQVP